MGMTNRQRWVLSFLGVLVVLVWVRGLTVPPARSRRLAASMRSAAFKSSEELKPTSTSTSEWGDNPFLVEHRAATPPVVEDTKGHSLAGILWDLKNPVAILDNRLIKVGDQLGPWEVVEIRKEEVILSDGMTTQILRVE